MISFEKRFFRRYAVEFTAAVAFYAATVVGVHSLLQHMPDQPLRMWLALLPMLPTAGVIWVGLRGFRRMDEMQRKMALEVIAISAFATIFLSLAYGFMERAGLPHLSMFAVWPVMGGIQAFLSVTARWWYRP